MVKCYTSSCAIWDKPIYFEKWQTRPPSQDQELIGELRETLKDVRLLLEGQIDADSIAKAIVKVDQALKSTEGGK